MQFNKYNILKIVFFFISTISEDINILNGDSEGEPGNQGNYCEP